MDFREFMLRQCDAGACPETCVAAFKTYCQEFAQREFDRLKNTGLCLDLYHPVSQLRSYEWRQSMAQQRAQSFLAELREGKYKDLSLRLAQPNGEATCPVAGHQQAPEFAFDANIGTLMISGLPCAVSVWEVVEALQDSGGFAEAAWSAPSADLSRTFYVGFSCPQEAKEALLVIANKADTLLSNKGLTNGVAKVSIQDPMELSALVLPAEMSSPERLAKDLSLSAEVIQLLDKVHEIRQDFTAELLHFQGSAEQKLDLQVIYLRRVHNFCFYAGKWGENQWTLRDSCGAAVVREPYYEPVQEIWAKGHEKRIKEFLSTTSLIRPAVLGHADPKVRVRFDQVCREKTVAVTEQKFQCKDCGKFFKGPEYVGKHLFRMHTEIMQAVREELHQMMAREAFVADPSHPLSCTLNKD
ncbi:Serrate RNA effector molecule homolog (Arsenite-resistance protein 2 homolog) [Durusdinium trenchii]